MTAKGGADLGGSRRRGSAPKAGSVWESRMKSDEVKGGIKVFNATHEEEASPEISDKQQPKQSPAGKRKTWKSETFAGLRSELSKNLDDNCKELIVSSIKKSPISIKKTRSGPLDQSGEGKSELSKNLDGDLKKSVKKAVDEARSDEEFDVCEEKAITSNVGQIKNPMDGGDELDLDDEDDDFVKIEFENKNLDIKEITVQDHKPKKTVIEEEKKIQSNEKSVPSSPVVKKQPPPAVNHAKFNPSKA